MSRVTPWRALVRGTVAGAAGTVAMDGFWYARYRVQGGHQPPLPWEFGGESTWEAVSAPAQLGRRLYEGLCRRPLEQRWARLTNNIMHWGYGIAWGGVLGVAVGSASRTRLLYGPAFGAVVWASSYVILPIAGLYKPIWEYKLTELGPDLTAHLTYGTVTESVLGVLL